jgi:hypothetical protein cdivTM7_00254
MSRKKKIPAKEFALQKRKRRQWITFVRMCRYGVHNFSRNAWLTAAATAMMTLTLFVIMVSLIARNVLIDTTTVIRDKVDISLYIKHDAPQKELNKMQNDISKLNGVKTVTFITPQQARQDYIETNKDRPELINALNIANTKFSSVIRVNLTDVNNTVSLEKYAAENKTYLKYKDPKRDASFAGDRRVAVDSIGRWVNFAEKMGLVISVVLITISSLVVFNTIRMAIFNRKEEIQMMKLIGADKGFIRGPFIVEAIVYGFIAAVIAMGLGVSGLMLSRVKLETYGIQIESTMHIIITYAPFVLLGLIVIGAIIGIISSLLATRRYLKI